MSSQQPDNTESAQRQAAAPAPRKQRLGDYELIGKLGQGAMGAVYLAEHSIKHHKVALKVLPPNLAQDQEFLERFRREARAASKLIHQNIVAALDVGFADNKYHYIAMEYVDGPNLETVLKKKGTLGTDEVLRVASDMAHALSAAEPMGIVHRDIKPANILVNSQGVSKLTDLGLASATKGDQRVTMAGFAVGTPYYISPEQARGTLDVDSRSDVYSLGVTLYNLATGQLPFPGNNPVVIMTQHISEEPAPAHVKNPQVPMALSVLIQKMMAKDPACRHQNAKELLADIDLVKKGQTPVLKHVQGEATAQPQQRQQRQGEAPVMMPNLEEAQSGGGLDTKIIAIAIFGTLAILALMYFVISKLM